MKDRFLTIIYDTEKMQQCDVENIVREDRVSAMAWGHLLDEVKTLRRDNERLKNEQL